MWYNLCAIISTVYTKVAHRMISDTLYPAIVANDTLTEGPAFAAIAGSESEAPPNDDIVVDIDSFLMPT